jgi:pimeloyl-ACP methyl ester carboxylesterase
MFSSRAFSVLALLAILTVGCGDANAPVQFAGTEFDFKRTAVIDGDGFTRVEGEAAGALFAVIRPDDWNGDLVLLLHGSVPADAPISLDPLFHWQFQPVADGLVERGFGVAFSSYRTNGEAVQVGTIDTRTAQAAYTSVFGEPEDAYIVSWSMGTHIAQKLVETAPTRYAGHLAVCGSVGGSDVQSSYFLDARVLFDHYFPGVLPWDVWHANRSLFDDVLPALQGAFVADPPGFIAKWYKLASIDQLRLPPGDGSPGNLLLAVLGSLLGNGGGDSDFVGKAGGIPVGNAGTVYTSELLSSDELDALNAGVARFEADPNAARYVERNYIPTGQLRGTPVLLLHTDEDAVVPVGRHLPAYERILAEAGTSDLFVPRVVPGFGHCEYEGDLAPDGFLDVQLEAFDDLVQWVQAGVKPAE